MFTVSQRRPITERLTGLWFSFHSISASISSVSLLKSVLFGMYWRISPLVFSFAHCSQEWYGRAKFGIKPFHDLLLTGEFISVLSRYPTYLVLVGYQSFSCRASQRSGSFSYKPADQHKMRTSVVCCHDTPLVVPANHPIIVYIKKSPECSFSFLFGYICVIAMCTPLRPAKISWIGIKHTRRRVRIVEVFLQGIETYVQQARNF